MSQTISFPTEDECYQIALDGFRVAFKDVTPPPGLTDDDFLGQLARALVNSTYHLLVAAANANLDSIPQDGSSFEALSLWAVVLGLSNGTNPGEAPYGPLVAQAATGGTAVPTGAPGTVIPEGATLVTPDGQITVSMFGAGTLPMGIGAYAFVNAQTPGAASNLATGTKLTWTSTPVGADGEVVLTGPTSGGSDGETAANPRPLLDRILYRLQNPPGSGKASDYRVWCEGSRDTNGSPIPGLRCYVYPLYDGVGTVAVVPLVPGIGSSRIPRAVQRDGILATGNAKRPVTSRLYIKVARIDGSRLLTVQVRAEEAALAYRWDWLDILGGYSVTAWAAGPPAKITIGGNISVVAPTLKAAVDKYQAGAAPAPRIQVLATSGPVVPGQVRVTSYVLGINTELILESPLPAGFVPPVAGDIVYAGGPIAAPAGAALYAYVNGVGPGRGKYADPNDPWDDTCRNSRLIEIVNSLVDTDGVTRMARVPVNGATIAIGAGAPAVIDVKARDVTGDAPEILVPKFIFVTQ